MQHVTFTLRTVTPLFLAGADQTQAELRAPTFRGLMRYWYRALIGGIVGANERTLPQVSAAETAVFGATDKGSAVGIRVSEASEGSQRYRKENYSRANTSGKDYLLWSMAESGKGDRYKPDRLYFPQDTKFKVSLFSRGDDEANLRQAVSSFWLLTHLGGIGSRSRRCGGSIEADVTNDSFAGFNFATPKDAESLQIQLRAGITLARQVGALQLDKENKKTMQAPIAQTAFDALTQSTCKIWILREKERPWSTADAAMRNLGASLQDYRSEFPLQEREVFGLPLGRNNARRASPLLLRVTKLQAGEHVGVAVLFKTGNPQSYALIENWANGFTGKREVTF